MENDRMAASQRYRSLVLCHVYIMAKGLDMPISRLPQTTLERLGIERRTDAASATTFIVKIPEDLASPAVEGMLGRFEREARENRHLFPKAPLKKEPAGSREGNADEKGARPKPRGRGGKRAVEEFDIEPLDEKTLMRMADAP